MELHNDIEYFSCFRCYIMLFLAILSVMYWKVHIWSFSRSIFSFLSKIYCRSVSHWSQRSRWSINLNIHNIRYTSCLFDRIRNWRCRLRWHKFFPNIILLVHIIFCSTFPISYSNSFISFGIPIRYSRNVETKWKNRRSQQTNE